MKTKLSFNSSLTIGIPVFNAEKFIRSSIQSALDQDYKNIVIQIHDNCSTDASFSICQQMAEQYSNIRLKKHSKNIGSTLNFQSILDECSTEYLCFLGADDTISSNWVSEQMKLADKKDYIGLGRMKIVKFFNGKYQNQTNLEPVYFKSLHPITRRILFIFSPTKIPRMIPLWGVFSVDRSHHFDNLFAGMSNGSYSDVLWSYAMLKKYKVRTIGSGIYYKTDHSGSESYKLLSARKHSYISRAINRMLNLFYPAHFFALLKRSSISELFCVVAIYPFLMVRTILINLIK